MFKTKEGYIFVSKEAAEHYMGIRKNNRFKFLSKIIGRSKYTPHQGKQECQRRVGKDLA